PRWSRSIQRETPNTTGSQSPHNRFSGMGRPFWFWAPIAGAIRRDLQRVQVAGLLSESGRQNSTQRRNHRWPGGRASGKRPRAGRTRRAHSELFGGRADESDRHGAGMLRGLQESGGVFRRPAASRNRRRAIIRSRDGLFLSANEFEPDHL